MIHICNFCNEPITGKAYGNRDNEIKYCSRNHRDWATKKRNNHKIIRLPALSMWNQSKHKTPSPNTHIIVYLADLRTVVSATYADNSFVLSTNKLLTGANYHWLPLQMPYKS